MTRQMQHATERKLLQDRGDEAISVLDITRKTWKHGLGLGSMCLMPLEAPVLLSYSGISQTVDPSKARDLAPQSIPQLAFIVGFSVASGRRQKCDARATAIMVGAPMRMAKEPPGRQCCAAPAAVFSSTCESTQRFKKQQGFVGVRVSKLRCKIRGPNIEAQECR